MIYYRNKLNIYLRRFKMVAYNGKEIKHRREFKNLSIGDIFFENEGKKTLIKKAVPPIMNEPEGFEKREYDIEVIEEQKKKRKRRRRNARRK